MEYSNLTENLEQVKHRVHKNRSGQATAEIDGEVKVYIPTGEVAFSSLPSQLYRRSLKKGFDFSDMVAGTIQRSDSLCIVLDTIVQI